MEKTMAKKKKKENVTKEMPEGYLWVTASVNPDNPPAIHSPGDFEVSLVLIVSLSNDNPNHATLLADMVVVNSRFVFTWDPLQEELYPTVRAALLDQRFYAEYTMSLEKAGLKPLSEEPEWYEVSMRYVEEATNVIAGEPCYGPARTEALSLAGEADE